MAEMYGVDVSEFQSVIDWDALNAVSQFVIIRATYGTLVDTMFERNQSEARRVQAAAGPLGIGYYSYGYPTLLGAAESANFFVDTVGVKPGEVMALDLEGNVGNDPVGWSLEFLQQVEKRTGIKAWIYLNQSEKAGYNWQPVVDAGYELWEAQYSGDRTTTPDPAPWPRVAGRQWSSTDQVAGIGGLVDGDTFYSDITAFNAVGLQVTSPVPVPAAPPVPVTPVPAPVSVPSDPAPTAPSPQPDPVPPVPGSVVQPVVTAPTSSGLPPATDQPNPTTKLDSLSKTPSPILVKIVDGEKVFVSWLGTTFGNTLLKIVGAIAGYLASNPALLHTSRVLTAVIGGILGGAVSNSQNPSMLSLSDARKK